MQSVFNLIVAMNHSSWLRWLHNHPVKLGLLSFYEFLPKELQIQNFSPSRSYKFASTIGPNFQRLKLKLKKV